MSWKRLQIEDIQMVLAQDEIEKLENLSKDPETRAIIQDILDNVSDAWRGALAAKSVVLSTVEHSTPSEYRIFILNFARHQIWTRFPQSRDIALDERRVAEYEAAMDLLQNPYINVSPPSPEERPTPEDGMKSTGSIFVPYMRIPPFPCNTNYFNTAINTGAYPPSEIPTHSCNCR